MAALIVSSRRLIAGPRGFRKPSRPVLDRQHPINRGLIGCWLLGYNIAGTEPDLSNSGRNATFHGALTKAGSHHGGESDSFNGSTAYLSAASLPPSTANFSLLAWVNMPSNPAGEITVIGAGTGSNRVMDITSGGAMILFNGTNFPSTSAFNISNKWFHLAGIQDGATIRQYVNGKIDTTTGGTSPTADSGATAFIGSLDGTQRFFLNGGKIEGVRIYNRALSAVEVAQLFAEPYAGIVEQAPRWRVALVGGTVTITLGQASWVWTGFAVGINSKTMIALAQSAWAWTGQALSINAKTMLALGQATWRWAARGIGGLAGAVRFIKRRLGIGISMHGQ